MSQGLKDVKSIEDFDLTGKRVFLRLDLNVPIKNGVIQDETRIQGALPTLRYAIEKNAKLILASHLGRPKTTEDRSAFSLEPVAKRLSELLSREVLLIEEPKSDAPIGLLPTLKSDTILMLENLRFDEGEEKNSEELAQHWAAYTDIYINDAFGSSHRAHASIVALPQMVKNKGIGFLIKKELEVLDGLLENVKSPYVALLGGAKVSDKMGVIENLMDKVDSFVIGGAMAYTFLKAQDIPVGKSLVEKEKLKYAKELIQRMESRNKQILLPLDHVITTSFDDIKNVQITKDASIPEGFMALDIGPKTRDLFAAHLKKAKTIFWNGPMGVFEKKEFQKGTFLIAETLAAQTDAIRVIGGGDSAAAVEASGLADKMTHISTGGGASLEYLQGDTLPGIEVLRSKRRPTT